MTENAVYLQAIRPLLGRALSGLDAEITSPTRGSFDRTWWCWKFTDFSATRFQEGAHVLAWLASSSLSPAPERARPRLAELSVAALEFWTQLQHGDGSFDEAYPFERSLAATAFTGFYLGCALERLRGRLESTSEAATLASIEKGAQWLARNGEYHGVLSNHLAAAAGALQVAGDLLGTDRFKASRDRYLGQIYQNQHPTESWMREYGSADPGYQSHGMFYLAEIERRSHDPELFERLARACDFMGWFVHPDGTIGGEYASRGTKFAYPAAFEMLASRVPAAKAIATHLRERLAAGRGVGAREMDAWNQFPLLNNLLFAAENAGELTNPDPLPWQVDGATAVFPDAGLIVARRGNRIVAAGGQMGGAVKCWARDGRLVYEDCGYAVQSQGNWFVSQGEGSSTISQAEDGQLVLETRSEFRGIPTSRFDPLRFVAFRLFTTTCGRVPSVSRWLKDLLVAVLIRRKKPHPGRLQRRMTIAANGELSIIDELVGLGRDPVALPRHVPFHMGSSRYADFEDWCGAEVACAPATKTPDGYERKFILPE